MSFNDMWVRNRTTKTNGVSYIIQKGAAAVFTPEGQQQIKANIRVYKNNAKMIMDALDKVGVWYTGGKNSPYVWIKVPDRFDSWGFFDYLLNQAGIIGTPGAGFGTPGEGFFRFCAFGDSEGTKEAAEKMKELLTNARGCA